MSISEADAVDAMRRFVAAREPSSAQDELDAVTKAEVNGRTCWLVRTRWALEPGEPEWAYMDRPTTTYFIDAASGRCIGYQAGNSRTFFSEKEEASPSLSDGADQAGSDDLR